MTAGDLINATLRLIGVLASGETASASESTDGLASLNRLIDSWSNESLLIPNKVRDVVSLVTSQRTYTMGTGGDFNIARAQKIENALIQLPGSSPVIELPMKILTKDEYAAEVIKTLTSTFPMCVYPDGAYPLDTLSVWPVPSASCSMVLYSSKPLATLAALTTALSVQPGCQRALIYSLAVELAPEYGKQLPESVVAIEAQSKAAIKRMNHRPRYLQVDPALQTQAAIWNWNTGEPT